MDEVYKLQVETLKTIANVRRLEISQPNVSQHLAVMRAGGVVEADRDGREVRYRLSDPEIIVACEMMRGVLARRLARISAAAARSSDELVAERTSGSAGGSKTPGTIPS
jgi:DNA-binding transcriptional ArsR family regulator